MRCQKMQNRKSGKQIIIRQRKMSIRATSVVLLKQCWREYVGIEPTLERIRPQTRF